MDPEKADLKSQGPKKRLKMRKIQNQKIELIPEIWSIIFEYEDFLINPLYSLTGLDQLLKELTSQSLNTIFKKISARKKAEAIYARLDQKQQLERKHQLEFSLQFIFSHKNNEKLSNKKIISDFIDRMLINIIHVGNKTRNLYRTLLKKENFEENFFINVLQQYTLLEKEQILQNLLINFTYLSIGKQVLKAMPVTHLQDPTLYELTVKKPYFEGCFLVSGLITMCGMACYNFYPLPELSWWSGIKATFFVASYLIIASTTLQTIREICFPEPLLEGRTHLSNQRYNQFLKVKNSLEESKKNEYSKSTTFQSLL